MKISIITLTFHPEPAQHLLDLAVGLAERGHKVTVLTSLPSYPFGKIYENYRGRLLVTERIQGVKVVRLPVLPSHSRSFLKRAGYYLTNAASTLAYNLITIFNPSDVTIVYHPPLTTALPALVMKAILGKKFIHWIQDMWPETLEAGGVSNTKLLGIIDEMAKYVYRHASHIMVLSEGFKRNLIEKGIPATKITAIPNWANPDKHPVQVKNEENFVRVALPPNKFYVLYAGNMGEMQALESPIKAIAAMTNDVDVVLLLLGSGTRELQLKQYAVECGVGDRVRFIGRVAPDDVNNYYAIADCLLVHIRDTKLFQITIPHKIYEYMLAAKPIVAAIKGDARAEVLAAGAGIACEPEDSESIASAILRVKSLSAEERSAMGNNGRKFILENRTPNVLIDQIERILVAALAGEKNELDAARI